MIKLLFTAKHAIGSYIIRAATWSSWSHVAFVTEDNMVIESIGFKGVRKVTLGEAITGCHKHAVVEFRAGDSKRLEAVLDTQVGKSYDYLGAVSIGLHRNWQHDDKWICSELIAWGLDKIGEPLFRSDKISHVSQEDFWRLAPIGQTFFHRH